MKTALLIVPVPSLFNYHQAKEVEAKV